MPRHTTDLLEALDALEASQPLMALLGLPRFQGPFAFKPRRLLSV